MIDRMKRIHKILPVDRGNVGTKRFNVMSSYLTLRQKQGFGSEFDYKFKLKFIFKNYR